MIGQWLEKCSDEQLGDVLTEKMTPHGRVNEHGRCLEGVVGDAIPEPETAGIIVLLKEMKRKMPYTHPLATKRHTMYCRSIGWRFDTLCDRFGIEHTNAVIRERCLKILAIRNAVTTPVKEPARVACVG